MADELTKAIAECYRLTTEHQQYARKAWLPSSRRYHLEMAERCAALAQSYQLRLILKRALDESSADREAA